MAQRLPLIGHVAQFIREMVREDLDLSAILDTYKDVDSDGEFGGLSLVGMGAQGGADDGLLSTDLDLDQGAAIVFSRGLTA